MITQHTEVNTKCWTVHKILLVIHTNPSMKAEPCVPFSWIWNLVNYFVQIRHRFPWGASLLSSTLLLFWVCGGSGADSSLSCSIWCHCWHLARWRQDQFFFSRIWYFWLNFKFLRTIFSGFIHARYIDFLKSWWDNICFLGVPCMLRMNM